MQLKVACNLLFAASDKTHRKLAKYFIRHRLTGMHIASTVLLFRTFSPKFKSQSVSE